MRKNILFLMIGLLFGLTIADLAGSTLIQPAKASSACEMDWFQLRHDYDFRRAVIDVVESYCTVRQGGNLHCW